MKKLITILSVLLMMLSHLAAAQDIKVSGSVTDGNGPVAGAFVVVKGTTNGTMTDLDGSYLISAPASAVLEFSCMGYVSEEIPVDGKNVINVTLKEDNQLLADAVVLGYGVATKKKDLSAAVGVISNPEALSARPVSSVEGMLQGQIAGVAISANGGDPTSTPSVVIRGQGSQKNEQVLWVVDGIPGAPIASLNDIESIVVLKDAASAAIYGAQSGAGGVILVTTKKGGQEGLSVNFDGVYGVRQATNLIESLNAEEAIQMRKISYANAGLSLPDAWDPAKNSWIKTTRTNWVDEVFRTAMYNRNSVSVNYNSDKLQSRLTFSNDDNDGVLVGTYNKKTGIHYTGIYKINKWVKLTEDLTWTQVNQRSVNTSSPENGVLINAIFMPQSAEAYAADGSFGGIVPANQAQWASAHGDSINPLRLCLGDTNYNKSNSLWSTTGIEIGNIVPGLKFNSRYTYAVESGFSKIFTPRRLEMGKPVDNNFLDYSSLREERWKTENTLTYDKTFGKHSIGGLLSTTADHFYGRYLSVEGQNLGDESVYLQYLANAGSVKAEDSFSGNDANLAFVARASYSYNDRYFFTASWRRDYAGRLGKGNNYGDFPAVTAAWKISNENFMPKSDQLNLLKLRASFGRIGNLGSIDMNYKSALLSSKNWSDSAQYGVENGNLFNGMYYYNNAVNPRLTWETSEQLDLGLDAELFRERLSVAVDFYNKRTFNLIQKSSMNWPGTIGLDPMLVNMGEVMNRGIEIVLGWNDKVSKDFSYNLGFNLAYNKNWVSNIGVRDSEGNAGVWTDDTKYKNVPYIYQTAEGQPIGSFYVIKTLGIFQSDEEAAAYVDKDGKRIQPNAKAGDLKFEDYTPDGTIDDKDRQYIGSAAPKFNYAFNGGFSWKNLSFNFMLQGVAGAQAAYMGKYSILNDTEGSFNRAKDILNAWSPTNTSSNIPRLSKNDPNGNFTTASDWYIEDASYLRIKNVTLTYDLTDALRKMAHFDARSSRLAVYFSGDNLFTFTKYSGMDPECGGYDALKYPVSRVLSLGVKLTY